MANQRDIKNRIKSITNTRKITSTMEMVASSKMKKVQNRLEKSKPYEKKLNEIIMNLTKTSGAGLYDPLFRKVAYPTKVIVVQITGNRGLCASFNSNVIEHTLKVKEKFLADGKESLIYSIGKKGTSFFDFSKEPVYKSAPNLEDKVTFEEAAKLATEITNMFIRGEVHEVYISYTKVITNASQKPALLKLLPISPDMEDEEEVVLGSSSDYIFEPNPAQIFSYILPLYIKTKVFTCLLESSFSEQFARRVAMKNATDASEDMIKELTITYNRVRQAKITNEIAEIVGGAAALS